MPTLPMASRSRLGSPEWLKTLLVFFEGVGMGVLGGSPADDFENLKNNNNNPALFWRWCLRACCCCFSFKRFNRFRGKFEG
jgi:hypothetical protein